MGIFYAMGFALTAEGFFSLCYHTCPTNISLQFDQAMMYIICILCYVKIYQFRHPDTTANAFSIFGILGFLILLQALLLETNSWCAYVLYLGFYLSMIIVLAFDFYYNGIGRLDNSIAWLLIKGNKYTTKSYQSLNLLNNLTILAQFQLLYVYISTFTK